MNSETKKKIFLNVTLLSLLTIFCFINTLYAESPSGEKNKQRLNKVTTNDSYQSFTINI